MPMKSGNICLRVPEKFVHNGFAADIIRFRLARRIAATGSIQ